MKNIICSIALLLVSFTLPQKAFTQNKFNIVDYYSPQDAKRPVRSATYFIILHTTEAGNTSSRNAVHRSGTANYLVETDGTVRRIIHRNKLAYHAGRSMWNNVRSLSRCSIGIEVVGYHNKPITEAQKKALKVLLEQLQRIYQIPDEKVLTHSMVAYGQPNRYHNYNHRGRKRCGMQFATKELRGSIGLSNTFKRDPDVAAGRLKNADKELAEILYSGGSYLIEDCPCVIKNGTTAWDIARDMYDNHKTIYTFPDGTIRRGSEITNWNSIPPGTTVSTEGAYVVDERFEGFRIYPKDGKTAWDIAGPDYADKTTIYFMPDGMVFRGDQISKKTLNALPVNTKVLVGYVYGGYVTTSRPAYNIAGKAWKYPSTLYRLPTGKIVYGDSLSEASIPVNTLIFFRK